MTVNNLLRISCNQFFLQQKNFITVKFAMGCIQRNEKLVFRRNWTVATKAVGFCERAAHVVKFINFFAARESNDR